MANKILIKFVPDWGGIYGQFLIETGQVLDFSFYLDQVVCYVSDTSQMANLIKRNQPMYLERISLHPKYKEFV